MMPLLCQETLPTAAPGGWRQEQTPTLPSSLGLAAFAKILHNSTAINQITGYWQAKSGGQSDGHRPNLHGGDLVRASICKTLSEGRMQLLTSELNFLSNTRQRGFLYFEVKFCSPWLFPPKYTPWPAPLQGSQRKQGCWAEGKGNIYMLDALLIGHRPSYPVCPLEVWDGLLGFDFCGWKRQQPSQLPGQTVPWLPLQWEKTCPRWHQIHMAKFQLHFSPKGREQLALIPSQ